MHPKTLLPAYEERELRNHSDKPVNITPVIATYGRWADVAKLAATLAEEMGTKPIIVNDAGPSPDQSLENEILRHSRLVVLPENLGQAGAVQEGMKLVKTGFAMIVDSDDFLDFENDWASVASELELGSLYLPYKLRIRNVEKARTNVEFPTTSDMIKNSLGTLSGMILSRDLYFSLQGFDGELVSCKDWDFWLRGVKRKAAIRTYRATLHYATDNPGISRDLWRVYRGRTQLWNKHPDVFRPATKVADILFLLRYSAANCAVVSLRRLCEKTSLSFFTFAAAHLFARTLYLVARPILNRV